MKTTLFLLALTAFSAAVNAQTSPMSVRPSPPVSVKISPVVPVKATLFRLEDVRLLPSPFQTAQVIDRKYLLSLDPDRLLAFMRQNAGLKPKAAHYGGWDNGGAGTIGHYLSACALMAQATGDPKLRQRVAYIVHEMAACQTAHGDGGLYGFAWDANTYFPKMATGELLTPPVNAWYGTHKTLAGLRDAAVLCGNASARDVLVKMADWCIKVTSKLTDAQWQTMLDGEHGGPHEIFADVYALTGDKKYLTLAEKFRHKKVFDPLAENDPKILSGLHANAQVPKFVGYERIYELTGDKTYHAAASNFWNDVTKDYSWVIGGNSQWEHFFAPDEFGSKVDEVCGPETCNTYNMLKLTRQLYELAPSASYMDYYERALYNHILPSESPTGGFVYYTSMRPGNYRVFSRPEDAFWCCVGTGMENHGEYGAMIYAAAPKRLFVNLFIPSVLNWKAEGATVKQTTRFPEEAKSRLTLTMPSPKKLTLSVRCPDWVAPGAFTLFVNGKTSKLDARPGAFVDVTRVWKAGDVIDIGLPMRVKTETLPHDDQYAAFLYGPLVLAGRLGTDGLTRADFFGGGDNTSITNQLAQKKLPLANVPVLTVKPDAARLVKTPGAPLAFTSSDFSRPVTLVPFYKIAFERYAIYWPVKGRADFEAEQKAARELEAATVDGVTVGESASEKAHGMTGEETHTGDARDPYPHWRDAKTSFGYTLKVTPNAPVALRVAYWGGDKDRTFDIVVDSQMVATQILTGDKPNEYVVVNYPVSATLTQGKTQIAVQFRAKSGSLAGGVYDLRVVRAPSIER